MGDHKPLYLLYIFSAFVMLVITVIFNFLSGSQAISTGLFLNGTGAVSNKYNTEVTPAGWTFSIWGFIYAYQAAFIVYALSTVCRRGPNNGYLYYDPMINPPAIYVTYSVNMACNIAWLFCWDREQMIKALGLLFFISLTLYICLFLSMRADAQLALRLEAAGFRRELWLIRGIVQNGLAMYATWVTIATLLNLNIVLVYRAGMSLADGGMVALGILTAAMLLYGLVDNFALNKFTRFTVTPYMVLIVALTGILFRKWDNTKLSPNFIFVSILLGLSSILSLIKLMRSMWWLITSSHADNKQLDIYATSSHLES